MVLGTVLVNLWLGMMLLATTGVLFLLGLPTIGALFAVSVLCVLSIVFGERIDALTRRMLRVRSSESINESFFPGGWGKIVETLTAREAIFPVGTMAGCLLFGYVGLHSLKEAFSRRINPFTLADAHSCYLLVCQGLKQPRGPEVIPVLVRAFREYGLPRAIRADNGRTDNGPPFASVGLGALAVWWVKLGIIPERIEARAERAARMSASDPQKGERRSSQAHQEEATEGLR